MRDDVHYGRYRTLAYGTSFISFPDLVCARRACHAVTAVCEYRGCGLVVANGAHSRDAVFDPCIELIPAGGERGGF